LSIQQKNKIVLSPIGEQDSELLFAIGKAIEHVFTFSYQIVLLPELLESALDPVRNQYHSTQILKNLAHEAPPNAIKVIAITNVDLFIPILTHVFGEAQLGGKACIVSTYRLGETSLNSTMDREAYMARTVKEAIHELGHTFNLRHCQNPNCIMHYCRSLRDVDRKGEGPCRYCKALLDSELKKLASLK